MADYDRDHDYRGRYTKYGSYNRYNQFVPDPPPPSRRDAEDARERERAAQKRNDDLRGNRGTLIRP